MSLSRPHQKAKNSLVSAGREGGCWYGLGCERSMSYTVRCLWTGKAGSPAAALADAECPESIFVKVTESTCIFVNFL